MTSNEQIKAAFGKAMRKLRAAAGLSQEELAHRAELHRTYIGDVERGERNISIVNIVKIAAALDVKLQSIVREMEKHLER